MTLSLICYSELLMCVCFYNPDFKVTVESIIVCNLDVISVYADHCNCAYIYYVFLQFYFALLESHKISHQLTLAQ